jgi:L-rhamnose mutarotase
VYERDIFQLLDLKTKKEFEFSHHRYFKPISHDLAKFITKRFVSRTKDYVIHIDLTYKKIFIYFSCEESSAGFTNHKTIVNEKVPKAFIPCSRGLLKPIKCLMEFIHMVRILFIFIAWRLFQIDFFDRSVHESTLDVRLIKLETMVSSIGN